MSFNLLSLSGFYHAGDTTPQGPAFLSADNYKVKLFTRFFAEIFSEPQNQDFPRGVSVTTRLPSHDI
jgi:hypothetical protein